MKTKILLQWSFLIVFIILSGNSICQQFIISNKTFNKSLNIYKNILTSINEDTYVISIVICCKKKDTIEYSLSKLLSASTLPLTNPGYYYKFHNSLYPVRLIDCDSCKSTIKLSLKPMTNKVYNKIKSNLSPEDVIIDGDHSTIMYVQSNNYYDSVFYKCSSDIPFDRSYLEQWDYDYILMLSREVVYNSLEITNSLSLNCIVKSHSFYNTSNDSCYLCFETDKNKKYRFQKVFLNGEEYSFDYPIKHNDSLFKYPNNDTIYIIRNNKHLKFILE